MTTLARTIKELEIVPGARIFIAPRKTKDIVTLEGSVIGGVSLVTEYKRMVPALTASLLDAGTKTKTKDVLRESLASRGATLSFCAKGERMHFSGSCLPEDLNLLIRTLVECLGESVFPKEEIAIAREIMLGELTEEKSETKVQAAGALSRAVYDPKHPNFVQTTALKERSVRGIERADLVSFAKNLGQGGLVLAVAGDVTVEGATKALQALKRLPKGTHSIPETDANKREQVASESIVRIAGKANIDTYLGASVPLTAHDARYVPFMFLSDMLGARGLSGHLMRTIRERDGLTYGIYTVHTGFDDGRDGLFRIWATFSPDTFAHALQMTRKEVALFFKSNIKEEAVQGHKERLIGGFLLGLSTTGGLVSALHKIGREGKPLSYLDEYPELLRSMTLEQIKEAADLIPLNQLSVAAAGTFADKA